MNGRLMRHAGALHLAGFLALCLVGPASAQVDAQAAQALAKESDCFKCHAVDRRKIGPAYKDVAAKYKGRAEAEDRLFKHVTTAPKIMLLGNEANHKIVGSKDPVEIRNLIRWILSL